MHKVALGLIGGGAIALSLSLVLGWLGIPHVMRSQIKKASRLQNGSDTYKNWKETPINFYVKYHLFNVTNPEEVQGGEKPRVKEMGPYTYLEKLKKHDIRLGGENKTYVYREVRTLYFMPQLSQGSESDLLTYLNIPFVTAAKVAHDFTDDAFFHSQMDEKLTAAGETLFKTATVREILFEGISILPYIEILKDPAARALGDIKIPAQLLTGKFSLGKNQSDDGTFEVKTGMTNYREFGQIVQWQNFTLLPYWKQACNFINGTDSRIFSPFLTRATVLMAYNPEACRTMHFVYEKDLTQKTIRLYRFKTSEKMFQGKKTNPDNSCFCTEKDQSICDRDGLLLLSGCTDGFPTSISQPHFLGAQQSLIDGVEGISPDEAKHKTFFDFEPITAIAVKRVKRHQLNVDLTPREDMLALSKVKNVALPIMWVEESSQLPEDSLKMFTQLYAILEVVDLGKWVMVFSSLGAILLGAICGALRKDKVEFVKQ